MKCMCMPNKKQRFPFKFAVLAVMVVFITNACHNDQPKLTLPGVKSTVQKVDVKINRYEQALFHLDPNRLAAELMAIQPEYSIFLGADLNNPEAIAQMQNYLGDPVIRALYKDVNRVFPDMKEQELMFSEAFTNYSSYFPQAKVPKLYTYISGVDPEAPVRLVDSVMIIGVDNFLGANSKFYKELGIPVYKSARFSKEFLVPVAAINLADKYLPEPNRNMSLLDWMVREGKRLYFLDCMLPHLADSLKIGYSAAKMEWSEKNSGNMWGYLLANNLLYKNDSKTIIAFVGDAPFTKGLTEASPGRSGVWLGWQIVRAYMSNAKNTSLPQLMQEKDSQRILAVSKYKPAKK